MYNIKAQDKADKDTERYSCQKVNQKKQCQKLKSTNVNLKVKMHKKRKHKTEIKTKN